MSQSKSQQTYHCEYCDDNLTPEEAIQPNASNEFCDLDCYHKHKGKSALDHIAQDHRFCSSCYRPNKVVYRPDESATPELRQKALLIRESFVGFETPTEFSETGNYGLECECGNVQHFHHENLLMDNTPYEWYLREIFTKFREEGQMNQEFDLEVFADTFWQENDLHLAVGKALYSEA